MRRKLLLSAIKRPLLDGLLFVMSIPSSAGGFLAAYSPPTTAGASVTASAPVDARYSAQRWWRTEQGLVAVVNEILKLGFYWSQYGISPFKV